MNIMYATDRNYAAICGVSIYSLLTNNRFEHIHIYIFEKNLGEEKKHFLELSKSFDAEFTFINVAEIEKICRDMDIPPFRGGYMAYARLFADRYIGSERILYLDCDTLIVGSIESLWSTDLQGRPAAAVIDCIHSLANVFLDKRENEDYFNSGVILFDFSRWEDEGCLKKLQNSLKKLDISKTATYGDQDILNHAMGDRFYKLSLRYNAMYITRYFSPEQTYLILDKNESLYYTAEEIREARKHPCIIHFSGRDLLRPWYLKNALSDKEKMQWEEYKRDSPWSSFLPIDNHVNGLVLGFIRFYLKAAPKLFCMFHGKIKKYSLKRRIKNQISRE